MKNLKKLTILLAILSVFGISCQNPQKPQTSDYDIKEEIPNVKPPLEEAATQFPVDFTISKKEFSFTLTQGSYGYTDTFNVKKGNTITTYSIIGAVPTIIGTGNPELIKHIKVNASTIKDMYVLTVKNTMFDALGAGNSAQIKVTLYIKGNDDSETKYNTGIKELIITVKR